MILSDRSWPPATRHDYGKELQCARRVTADFGFELVANGYFQRDPIPLANAIARRLAITFRELRQLVRQQTNVNLRKGHVVCERLGYI